MSPLNININLILNLNLNLFPHPCSLTPAAKPR